MSAAPRLSQVGDLVIDQDLEFQRRSWRIQRIGQCFVGLFVLGGLLGLFGKGWLARRELAQGPLRVEHPRFLRLQTPDSLTVRITPDGGAAVPLELWMDDPLAELFEIAEISPAPTAQSVRDGRLIYRFDLSGAPPATIRFRIRPRDWGWRRARLGLVGGPEVELKQLVYP